VLVFHPLVDGIVDRFRLAIRATGADHQVVGVSDDAAEIELDDVERLAIGRVLADGSGDRFRRHCSGNLDTARDDRCTRLRRPEPGI
jgi:hypothetical protein